MKRSILCAAALALVGTFQAQAGDINPQRQVVVRYDDINVKQATGARILLARLEAAAKNVCGPRPDLGAWETYRSCTKTAMRTAMSALPFDLMANIDSPCRKHWQVANTGTEQCGMPTLLRFACNSAG